MKADFLEDKGKPVEEIDGMIRRKGLDLELRKIIEFSHVLQSLCYLEEIKRGKKREGK